MPNYDINHYRSLFPYLKTGLIYLDHAAIGPFPIPVRDAVNAYVNKKSETEPNVVFEFFRVAVEVRERIGKLLNSPKERIALTDNTTNGLNIIAAGLEWKSGDRILLTDIEFPANVSPFMNQRKHGVEIDFVKSRGGRIPPEDVERAMTPKTRLLSISHVQFLHGFRSDLVALGELCRRKGIIFCVDAIQSAGVVPIDVQAMKIDFLSSGCQKWLLAPEGVGFVYVSETTQEKIHQAHLGWTSNRDFFSDFFRYRIDLDPTARRYENSTLNVGGVFGLHASLGLLLEVGISNIQSHLELLTQSAINSLAAKGREMLTPSESKHRAGIVTFRHHNAQQLFEKLKTEKISVSLREGCIRLSPHFYNTKEELEKTLDLIEESI
jgi:selenocysteine lyase/cysteine desulfurase